MGCETLDETDRAFSTLREAINGRTPGTAMLDPGSSTDLPVPDECGKLRVWCPSDSCRYFVLNNDFNSQWLLVADGSWIVQGDIERSLYATAIDGHQICKDVAVFFVPHVVTGARIFAFVALANGVNEKSEVSEYLQHQVRKDVGDTAVPDGIALVSDIPKTRAGIVMRGTMRKIVNGYQRPGLGDTSVLRDEGLLDELIAKVNAVPHWLPVLRGS